MCWVIVPGFSHEHPRWFLLAPGLPKASNTSWKELVLNESVGIPHPNQMSFIFKLSGSERLRKVAGCFGLKRKNFNFCHSLAPFVSFCQLFRTKKSPQLSETRQSFSLYIPKNEYSWSVKRYNPKEYDRIRFFWRAKPLFSQAHQNSCAKYNSIDHNSIDPKWHFWFQRTSTLRQNRDFFSRSLSVFFIPKHLPP